MAINDVMAKVWDEMLSKELGDLVDPDNNFLKQPNVDSLLSQLNPIMYENNGSTSQPAQGRPGLIGKAIDASQGMFGGEPTQNNQSNIPQGLIPSTILSDAAKNQTTGVPIEASGLNIRNELSPSLFNRTLQRFGGMGEGLARKLNPVTDTIGGLAGDWSQMLEQRARKGGLSALAPEYSAGMQKVMDREQKERELNMRYGPGSLESQNQAYRWANLAYLQDKERFDQEHWGGVSQYDAEQMRKAQKAWDEAQNMYEPGSAEYLSAETEYERARQQHISPVLGQTRQIETPVGMLSIRPGPDGRPKPYMFYANVPETWADSLDVYKEQAIQAERRMSIINKMRNIAETGDLETGPLSTTRKWAAGVMSKYFESEGTDKYQQVLSELRQYGPGQEVPLELKNRAKEISDEIRKSQITLQRTQEYDALGVQLVGEIITMFGAGAGLSDADREYAQFASAVTSPGLTIGALRGILGNLSDINVTTMKRYNTERARMHGALPGRIPQGLENRAELGSQIQSDLEGAYKHIWVDPWQPDAQTPQPQQAPQTTFNLGGESYSGLVMGAVIDGEVLTVDNYKEIIERLVQQGRLQDFFERTP